MDPADTLVLLTLVKPRGDRWPVEATIVGRLSQWRGGGWLWARTAAEWTGANEVVCRRALGELDKRRIIKRDRGDSPRGDNRRWCAVNDDWRRWDVEWLLDPSQIPAQLAQAAQQRYESPLGRIFARSISARSVARIARSMDARSWDEDWQEMTGIARSMTARSQPVENSHRAILIARSVGRHRAVLERAMSGESPKEVSHSGDGDVQAPPTSSSARGSKERVMTLGAQTLKARVVAAAIPAPGITYKYLSGSALGDLLDLVDEHGLDRVTGALDRIEPGTLSPVRIVETLGDLVLIPDDDPVLDHGRPEDPAAMIAALDRQAKYYTDDGCEPPQHLLDELARWQTVVNAPQEVDA